MDSPVTEVKSEMDRLFSVVNYQVDLIGELDYRLRGVSTVQPSSSSDKASLAEPSQHLSSAIEMVIRNNELIIAMKNNLVI